MDVLELSPTDHESLAKLSALAGQVYADDPVWVPQSESALASLLAGGSNVFVRPLLCVDDGVPLARAVALLRPGAVDDHDHPLGYVGFFECLEAHAEAGRAVLERAEAILGDRGAIAVQAPRVDNMLMGLVVEGFGLSQTVLTPHNPPYYADILLSAGYRVRERLVTYVFDRTSAPNLPATLPGFVVRAFDRQRLDDEVRVFHTLQQEIFGDHPGWVARTLAEDRRTIEGFLPMLDDELVLIAEDGSGRPVGLLVCLPDVYRAFRGQPVDNARLISIGVLPGYIRKGVGLLMSLQLARNLIAKGYQTLEASWIRDSNLPPQELARRLAGCRGREFALFEKDLVLSGSG